MSRFRPSFDTCDQVTPQCPVEATTYGAFFNLPACVIFTAFHSICLIYQIWVLIKARTWSFSIFLAIGTAFELMGYAARISMTPIGTVWSYPAFVIQLLMLILGPTLVAAAISVTFKWIVLQEGAKFSPLKPKWYPWVYVGSDFLSSGCVERNALTTVVIQAIGGAVSATATDFDSDPRVRQAGSALLIAGTAFQAANMAFCGGLMLIYWRRLRVGTRGSREKLVEDEAIKKRRKFHIYLYAIIVGYCAILIRCIYRIPEMAMGWGSELMQDETLFLVLDGAMIALAVLLLTIFHPAFYFPILRSKKRHVEPADPVATQPEMSTMR